MRIDTVRPIIEANKARYRKQRLMQNRELVDEDVTAIFERTDDDLALEEENTINMAMQSVLYRNWGRF